LGICGTGIVFRSACDSCWASDGTGKPTIGSGYCCVIRIANIDVCNVSAINRNGWRSAQRKWRASSGHERVRDAIMISARDR